MRSTMPRISSRRRIYRARFACRPCSRYEAPATRRRPLFRPPCGPWPPTRSYCSWIAIRSKTEKDFSAAGCLYKLQLILHSSWIIHLVVVHCVEYMMHYYGEPMIRARQLAILKALISIGQTDTQVFCVLETFGCFYYFSHEGKWKWS